MSLALEGETDEIYHPEDALAHATQTTLVVGIAGFGFSAIQNTLTRSNVGAWGIVTRTGATTAAFLAVGATYGFTKTAAANLREKRDHWNDAMAGFLAGGVAGMRIRTFPAVIGFGAAFALLQGGFSYMGGDFSGFLKDSATNEYDRKEELRKNRRRPVQETIEQLGEGNGIYGPNYRERRAQRLKDTYGIDVPRT